MEKKLTNSTVGLCDDDYFLTEGAAWLAVANAFSIRVRSTDEGVSVSIYKTGEECSDSIAETYAFFTETQEDE